jgi:hypothetical protein
MDMWLEEKSVLFSIDAASMRFNQLETLYFLLLALSVAILGFLP